MDGGTRAGPHHDRCRRGVWLYPSADLDDGESSWVWMNAD